MTHGQTAANILTGFAMNEPDRWALIFRITNALRDADAIMRTRCARLCETLHGETGRPLFRVVEDDTEHAGKILAAAILALPDEPPAVPDGGGLRSGSPALPEHVKRLLETQQ